jgi:hypothetical protein
MITFRHSEDPSGSARHYRVILLELLWRKEQSFRHLEAVGSLVCGLTLSEANQSWGVRAIAGGPPMRGERTVASRARDLGLEARVEGLRSLRGMHIYVWLQVLGVIHSAMGLADHVRILGRKRRSTIALAMRSPPLSATPARSGLHVVHVDHRAINRRSKVCDCG